MPDGGLLASLQPALVGRWAADATAPTSRVVDGTVVSADISGFTRLAERLADDGPRLAAETLNATINRCFEPMIDEILARGGEVLKFGGDALFALFDGDGRPDHARQASAAAVRMQELLAEADTGIDVALSMTVGLASGPIDLVLAGDGRRELVVAGATVDECLRLEAEAEPGEVLVATGTAVDLPDDWLDDGDPEVIALTPAATDHDRPAAVDGAAGGGVDLDWDRLIGPELSSAVAAFDGAGGELRVVTIAFVDLPTRDLDPATVHEVVTRADHVCRRHGVTLLSTDVSTGGIKLLIAAGAPTRGDADEDAMLGALIELIHDPASPPMRAGVNRGLVYAGFLGSARCRTFTVMGDPTNLAARLLGQAELGAIAVSQPVLDSARARYPTTELPPILVKGRLAPVTVHRLDGPASGDRETEVHPSFVGREEELATIRAALADLRLGSGAAIALVGESGVGSSRLIAEALDDLPVGTLRLDLTRRLAGRAPYAAALPFLRGLAGIEEVDDDESAIATLRAWLDRVAPEAAARLPLLAPAFGLAVDDNDTTEGVQAEFRQGLVNDTIADVLGAVLTGPTVMVAEDVHHHDPASLALAQAIADRCADRPWLLVTSTRPDQAVITGGRALTLGPLPVDRAEELMAELGDLPGDRRRDLAERSGGNPRFAIELLQVDDGGFGGSGPDRSGADLRSIEALITARIDRLGHEPRVLLRTAAVLGRRFSLPRLRALVAADRAVASGSVGDGGDGSDGANLAVLPAGLDRLIDPAGDGWFAFRSGAIHQVAYDGLSAQRRRHLHHLVADLLEREEADVAELAWHHEQAGDDARCWDYSRRAAERARTVGLMQEAATQLGRAVAAGERAGPDAVDEEALTGAIVDLFYTSLAAKREADAVTAGRRALDRLDPTAERARLAFRLAYVQAELDGSYGEQADWLDRELAEVGDGAGQAEARAWLSLGRASLSWRNREADRSLAAAERAVAEARSAGAVGPQAPALLIRHLVLAERADPARAAAADELVEAATAADDTATLITGHNNIGLDLQDSGRWDEAAAHYEAGLALAERVGDGNRAQFVAVNRAVLDVDRGRWDEARPLLDESRRQASYGGGGSMAAWIQLELARLEVHAGLAADGRRWLDEAATWFEANGTEADLYEVALLRLAADLADGRSQEVLDGTEKLVAPDEVVPRLVGRRALHRGYAFLQQARGDEAVAELSAAVVETEGVSRFGQARALVGLAEAERVVGRGRSARRTLARAEEILADLGVDALPRIPLPN